MTVKELIKYLLDCSMDATVVVEIPTQEGYKYTTNDDIEHCWMIDDEQCLISAD